MYRLPAIQSSYCFSSTIPTSLITKVWLRNIPTIFVHLRSLEFGIFRESLVLTFLQHSRRTGVWASYFTRSTSNSSMSCGCSSIRRSAARSYRSHAASAPVWADKLMRQDIALNLREVSCNRYVSDGEATLLVHQSQHPPRLNLSRYSPHLGHM